MTSRTRASTILVAAVVLVASACQQWPSMRGDNANTAFNASENVLSLADAGSVGQLFSADLGVVADGWQTPVVSGSQIFAPAAGALAAFDLNGASGCSGTPTTCQPLWRGDVDGNTIATSATATGTNVYVVAGDGSGNRTLYAFDVRGEAGCGGAPRWCQPLWTATNVSWAPPVIVGSTLYAATGDGRIAAYDASGTNGCGATPKVCSPLWRTAYDGAADSSPVAVANGTLFATTFGGEIRAYDAAGVEGCSGVPATCLPRWVGETGGEPSAWPTSPVVSGGRVYVAMDQYDWEAPPGETRTVVTGFALDGGSGCVGDPGPRRRCQPEWSAIVDGTTGSDEIAAAYDSVYVQTYLGTWPSTSSQLVAIDQDDPACTPGPCDATWRAPLATASGLASPIVANGVVYADRAGSTAALDAHGVLGCGGTPTTCTPTTFVSYPDLHSTGWSVSNGKLAIITNDGASGGPWPSGPRHTLRVIG